MLRNFSPLWITPATCVFALATGAVSGAAGSAASAGLEPYAGKWQLTLADTGTSFRASCLDLKIAAGGEARAELVWRWGSVASLKQGPGGFEAGKNGELLVYHGDFAEPLALRRIGNALEGSVKLKDGKLIHVIGRRDAGTVDPSGTWDLAAEHPEGKKTGVLTIRNDGAGHLQGQLKDAEGKETLVEEVSLDGNQLRVQVSVPRQGREAQRALLSSELRGDVLVGTAEAPGAKPERMRLEGQRRRQWGKPMALLREKGLEGWRPREESGRFGWTCEGGVLTNADHDVDIATTETFKDFKLHVEFKTVEKGNSGVYLRGRYEVQIEDDYGKGVESHGMGAIYSRIPQRKNASKPAGTWQTYDITLVDRYVTVVLNGETIIDNERLEGITGGAEDASESSPGPLLLQGDHGKVWFRNVVVTPALEGQ